MYDILVSPAEMAKRCCLTEHAIKRLCRTGYGDFPSTKVGTHHKMNPDQVNDWIEERVRKGLPLWESK